MNWKIKNLADLGIRTDNLSSAFLPYLFLTVLLLIGLIGYLHFFGASLLTQWHKLYGSLLVLAVLAFLQELFFRGYLMFVLRSAFKNPMTVILINSFLFSAVHLALPARIALLPESFLAGIAFASVYYYYPNVIWASVVHTLLNLAVPSVCYYLLSGCLLR